MPSATSTDDDRQLIIVSNRLPVRLEAERNADGTVRDFKAEPTAGGLASALAALTSRPGCKWLGWPGTAVNDDSHGRVRQKLAELDLHPVFLRPDQEHHYYSTVANEVFWPLFHYFTDKVHFSAESWQHYVDVNRMFADEILSIAEEDARVWVHDFHLMLVPQYLREQRPDLEIGFFLHVPFPGSEIYRLLPTREDVLNGLLGADYISFHTHDYARHFRSCLLRVLGVEPQRDHVKFDGRRIEIGINPIGIDVAGFEKALREERTIEIFRDLDARFAGRRVMLGVERLDYTKGVKLKLQAFADLLEKRPEFAETVTLVQVLVPSRLASTEYQELKSDLEEMIASINGRFGSPGHTPIEYMHRNFDRNHLAALYRLADVCMVTPVRDGMNLVAQEYVLCKSNVAGIDGGFDARPGALVLSEFAGAAQQLPHALLVNPWNAEETVSQLECALEMTPDALDRRLAPMVTQVRRLDSRRWGQQFLQRMGEAAERSRRQETTRISRSTVAEICDRFLAADRRTLFLDYDGTLREIVRLPEAAVPTHEIINLLQQLSKLPETDVHVVSGRHRDNLEFWFGELSIDLSAEHGFAHRPKGGIWSWQQTTDLSWLSYGRTASRGSCRRGPRHLRRTQTVRTCLALPPCRPRLRRLAGARTAQPPRGRPEPRRGGYLAWASSHRGSCGRN